MADVYMEAQYLALHRRILEEGVMIPNERTGVGCLTVINADFVYDVRDNKIPLVTTRKAPWKMAVAEMLGYLRGCDSAAQFRALGTKSWDANANENKAWLANPNRKGHDCTGRIYGVQARDWTNQYGEKFDQLKKIITNLSNKKDDRREIMTFWNPGEMDYGCLAPCMHTHNFSLLGDDLYLTSFQRSIDGPLGLVANMTQCAVLLLIVAQITGNKAHSVYHKMVNCHIYENQIELMRDVQLQREPYPSPTLCINPDIKTLEDLETWVTVNDFWLEEGTYQHHDPINYPFSV